MSSHTPNRKRRSAPAIRNMKQQGERIVALTAYDVATAGLAEVAGIDLILVGDSVGMVVLGEETTIPVTLDTMIHHAKAVARVARQPLLVGDMPYLTYHTTPEEAVRNAGRFVQEGGMGAVKMEGGRKRLQIVRAVLDAEIPVLGHLGLTPQSYNALGGFRVQGRTEEAAAKLLEDALALEQEGVFGLVLEGVPPDVALRITGELRVPTIGIGAGAGCDGQILVFHDALGLHPPDVRLPKFVRQFASMWDEGRRGIEAYVSAVRDGSFPSPEESYPSLDPDADDGS